MLTIRYVAFLFVFAVLAWACTSVEINQYDCLLCPGGCEEVVEDVGLAEVVPEPWVGTACLEHVDCSPGMCFTPDFLKDNFGLDVEGLEIPNGMCSFPMCDVTGATEQCGHGGTCFNTKPFSGEDIGICLLLCDEMVDCRWEEGYNCFRTELADEQGACIPDSLQVIIECDDGHCDEPEGEPEEEAGQ